MTPGQNAALLALTALQAWATAIAVIVSAGSVIALVIQITLTRRSIRQSGESVKATQSALADSQRGRIDQEMPKLTVTLHEDPGPATAWVITNPNGAIGEPRALPDRAKVFVVPGDGGELLCARAIIAITNSGPRPAVIEIFTNWEYGQRTRNVTVEVGTTELVPIDRVLGFTQWVAYATFAEKQAGRKANDAAPTQPDGNPMTELETQIAILTYKFPGDTGAIETRRITQTGSALDPLESNNSGWTIKDPAVTEAWALRTTVHPFERVYFASFKEDRRL